MSAPTAERIAQLRELDRQCWDGEQRVYRLGAEDARAALAAGAYEPEWAAALTVHDLLAALDYVAERLPVLVELCTDFPCRHPDCIGTRELLTYIGAPQPARAQEGGAG